MLNSLKNKMIDNGDYLAILPNDNGGTMNNFQKRDYLDKAAKFKALGHPTRLWIVSELSDNMEHCVCEFVDAID